MYKTLIICTLLFLSLNAFGKKDKARVKVEIVEMGKNYITGQSVKAKKYIFEHPIEEILFDSANHTITVETRQNAARMKQYNILGDVIVYNLDSDKIRWRRGVDFGVEKIQIFKGLITRTKDGISYIIDPNNGQTSVKIPNEIFAYTAPERHIALGYKRDNYITLEGLDITNAAIIWKRPIDRQFDWNQIIRIDDSNIIVSSSGLHKINLSTGNGWDYKAITGLKNYRNSVGYNAGAVAAGVAAGVAIGMLTGAVVVPGGQDDEVLQGLHSEVLQIDNDLIYASAKEIIRISENGKIKWESELDKDKTGKTSLFIKDQKLYLINHGIGYVAQQKIFYGKPYIAAFDINTGNLIFRNEFDFRQDNIISFLFSENELILSFASKIISFDLKTGKTIAENEIKIPRDWVTNLLGYTYYIRSGDMFHELNDDSNFTYALTAKGRLLKFNKQLEITTNENDSNLYYYFAVYNGNTLLSNNKEAIIINQEGHVVASFNASRTHFFLRDKLYMLNKNELTVYDIEDMQLKNGG